MLNELPNITTSTSKDPKQCFAPLPDRKRLLLAHFVFSDVLYSHRTYKPLSSWI
jgi:hypothetical protein